MSKILSGGGGDMSLLLSLPGRSLENTLFLNVAF